MREHERPAPDKLWRTMLELGSLRLHWSLALGALPFCAPRFSPLLLLAFALVVLAHMAGHQRDVEDLLKRIKKP